MTENPDPWSALRTPHQPVQPDQSFARDLLDRLRAELLSEQPRPDRPRSEGPRGETDMTTSEAPVRAETRSLSPYLVVSDARRALDFYVEVFGATRRAEPIIMPDGKVGHAELAIGDSVLMMAEEFPEIGHVAASEGGASIRVEVLDARAAVARAAELGAEVVGEVEDRGHGLAGRIRDPFGQRWLVSQAPPKTAHGKPLPRHGEAMYFTFQLPDDAAAKAFYGAVLGWQFSPGSVAAAWGIEGSALPDAGLWGGQRFAGWKLMYAVDDLDAAADRVRAAGGEVREFEAHPWGRTADCVDDQGIEFWLWHE